MKILFLVFHGFDAFNGISKKIGYQIEALRILGHQVGSRFARCGRTGTLETHGRQPGRGGFRRRNRREVEKRWRYGSLARYIVEDGFDFVYMRSDHNANPFTIRMARRVRRAGIAMVMEIPTYPYDQEYRTLGLKEKTELAIDRIYRRALARQLRAVVTFSDLSSIFGQRTIRISNGVSFERIPVRREHDPVRGEVHLVAVADISFWHGFDRLVRGWRLIMLANSARPTCT